MARRYRRSGSGSYRGRKYAYSAGRGGFAGSFGGYGLNLSTPWLAGAVVGFTNLDEKIPAELTLAASSIPLKGRGIGPIKGFAQGVLCGNLIQSLVANKGISGQGSNFGI